MKRIIYSLLCFCAMGMGTPNIAEAQEAEAYKGLPPIHVEGKNLVDDSGAKIVLHGVMDTPNPYFNSYRWGGDASDANVLSCRAYFKKLFTAITDHNAGTYCNVFRLHLDPCWTNDSKITRVGEGGEHNISQYSGTRLNTYLKSLYVPIAKSGMDLGLYIIMRPPGVCPNTIYVDGEYQKYLIDVWDRVTKNADVLKYYGHISIELANEPINIKNANGTSDTKTMKNFFQPVVDKIRENGFKGIIWIPGTGYQSNYKDYKTYPIIDPLNNFGYAVHDYPGWYSASDESYSKTTTLTAFMNSVPVWQKRPIMVTEIDWSPYVRDENGELVVTRIDEQGNPVYKNYGTWGTASTSKWGSAFKNIHDVLGNVGMTLTGTSDYIDIDAYIKKKKIIPAFQGNEEACGEACWKWYKEFWEKNVKYKEAVGIKDVIQQNDEIISTEYYTLDGRKTNDPQPGINIVRTKYKSGTVKTVKEAF